MQQLNASNLIKLQSVQQPLKKLEIVTNFDDYEKKEVISNGSFSIVYEGTLRGEPVAIKVARIEGRKSILKELLIYDKVCHPHILPALGAHFGIDDMLFLALRKYSLREYLYDYGNELKFPQLRHYSIEIADAMKYLHNKHILHCDLKVDNILIQDEKGEHVEISDFACAIDLERDHSSRYCGTVTHTSYELLKHITNPKDFPKSDATTASDVWTFGVTMWQIFTKSDQLPIDFLRREDIIKNYEAGKKLPIPATVSEGFWRFIFLPCFDLHPIARPSMEDLHKKFLALRKNMRRKFSSSSATVNKKLFPHIRGRHQGSAKPKFRFRLSELPKSKFQYFDFRQKTNFWDFAFSISQNPDCHIF